MANEEQRAINKTSEAIIKQFGLDKKAKKLAKKYVPKYIRKHSGFIIATGDAINKQKIYWKWKWKF